ncbi:GroES-like protein [Daedaleopsis nitida]|nr:GroES-like protein [Daedaleopsis nitida]
MSATSLPHPDSYTAYAFTEHGGKLHKITVPWKTPQPNEIVVKVLACGVCGSDEQVPNGVVYDMKYPRVPGHEIVGDVVAVSATEKLWKLGQRVGGGWHGGHCHACARCRAGDYITCAHEDVNGIFRDGGYAEFVTLRSEAVVSVPVELDPVQAAPLLCAGVTCFSEDFLSSRDALRHMNVVPPEYVAIQGVGGLGHLGLQFANAMGYRVVALSSGPSKEALSKELGAHVYLDGSKVDQGEALKSLGGAKVILCTAPNADVIQKLLSGLSIDGTLCLLALELIPISVSPTCQLMAIIFVVQMVGGRLSIRGWASGDAKDSEDCLQFALAHNVKCMVEIFPLDQAQEAYDHRSSARFRAVVVPHA